MTLNTVPRALAAVTLAGAAALALTACGDYNAPGQLGQLQQQLESCPDGLKVATRVDWDGTGSGRSTQLDTERLAIIEQLATEVAICGGHFTVTGYSSSSGATVTLYDAEITMPGATSNAQLRRVPQAVEDLMTEIESAYPEALASLPAGGSDISGVWRLASEQQAQLGDGYQFQYVNLTDGLDNVGVTLDAGLTAEQAVALANQISVPNLDGAEVTIAGIGRVAGNPVSSHLAEALVAYYDRLCERTGAASCLAVTDWR